MINHGDLINPTPNIWHINEDIFINIILYTHFRNGSQPRARQDPQKNVTLPGLALIVALPLSLTSSRIISF